MSHIETTFDKLNNGKQIIIKIDADEPLALVDVVRSMIAIMHKIFVTQLEKEKTHE